MIRELVNISSVSTELVNWNLAWQNLASMDLRLGAWTGPWHAR